MARNQKIIDEVSKFLGENINDQHTCVCMYIFKVVHFLPDIHIQVRISYLIRK